MSANVVVTQPGQKGAAGPMQLDPTSMGQSGVVSMTGVTVHQVHAGLPPALAYLAGLNEVRIHQQMELLEVVGWERNNRYTISNNQEQQLMLVKESSDCLTRQCCGPFRPFVMDVTDNQGQQLLQFHRPCRCQGMPCWCCYLQQIEIHSPPEVPIGRVEEIWTLCTPKYKVYDNNDHCVFTIIGDCCPCKCCADKVFRVCEGDGEGEEVGQVRKHFGGAREICGGASDFSLFMPANMDVMKKGLLLGATFLIDFNYFEAQ